MNNDRAGEPGLARVFTGDTHDVGVVLEFYVPPTAKFIRRRDFNFKSHPKDWRSPGLNSQPVLQGGGGQLYHCTTEAIVTQETPIEPSHNKTNPFS